MHKINRREVIKQSGLALAALSVPHAIQQISKFNPVTYTRNYDIIIIGGSYSGLSAAMALGRALRNVLIIDSGLPCNRQTPHAHNFITHDGEQPAQIAAKAKEQVLNYKTINWHTDIAVHGMKTEAGFEVKTQSGKIFHAPKLIFASGVKDLMPDISGFSECWGISVVHCPYCHGYEIAHRRTGILANAETAYHYAKLIRNWTKDLTIFSNGPSAFSAEQMEKLKEHHIPIIEKEITMLQHENGYIKQVVFRDNSTFELDAIYSRPPYEQHCKIPESLGCELTDQGLIKVDMFQKTNIPDIFACGDSTSMMRSVAFAVSSGNIAGAVVNNSMIEEAF